VFLARKNQKMEEKIIETNLKLLEVDLDTKIKVCNAILNVRVTAEGESMIKWKKQEPETAIDGTKSNSTYRSLGISLRLAYFWRLPGVLLSDLQGGGGEVREVDEPEREALIKKERD
jgi:hypothetical protein